VPPLNARACNEYVHIMPGLRKIRYDLRNRCIVCEIRRNYRGFSTEFLDCLEGLFVALISLPGISKW
jgi:hypothetical protein